MSKAETYRRCAEKCLEFAEAALPKQRLRLIEIAWTWNELAREQELADRDRVANFIEG